jgi:hypothetical protein
MARLIMIPLLLMLGSCAVMYQPPKLHEGGGIKVEYEEQIKDWQERVRKEKWSESLVDEIVQTSQVFARYTIDEDPNYRWKNDYWFTPLEMINANFNGDCEDIGSLIFGTFKKLNYPYDVRLLIAGTIQTTDHLLVNIELPDGRWKKYETVKLFLSELDGIFYRPKVEFDESHIWIYDPIGTSREVSAMWAGTGIASDE